jgi:hypothetical protein
VHSPGRLNEMARSEQLPFSWYGEFSIFHMLFGYRRTEDIEPDRALEVFLEHPRPLANRFRMSMNVLGFDINTRCSGLLSAIHSENDVELFVSAASKAGAMLKREGLRCCLPSIG